MRTSVSVLHSAQEEGNVHDCVVSHHVHGYTEHVALSNALQLGQYPLLCRHLPYVSHHEQPLVV